MLSKHNMERKVKQAAPDTRTIDIQDEYSLEFWAREFNVSRAKLKAAVLLVGDTARDVRREVKK